MMGGLHALAQHWGAWADACARDPELTVISRQVALRLGLSDGVNEVCVDLSPDGFAPGREPEVTLVAPAAAWSQLLSADPEPTMHHFLAMRMRAEGARIEGSELRYAQNAHVIRRLLELAREVVDGPIRRASDPHLDVSVITGRYVHVTIDGTDLSLYAEHAGQGQDAPILVLHTAGADGRQAHPLMSDQGLTARHQVFAFDMPGHGRSSPFPEPRGAWTLTPERYRAVILAVADALNLDKPILLGASMGGEACLMMAHRDPQRFGGVIACEATDYVPGRLTPWAGHPQVNEMVFVPEWIDGLISPSAPSSMRDLILRTYSQGGHRMFAGDIDFYSGGWDGRDAVQDIDTSTCPVVMMTGEYDYSCTPAMSEATAQRIPGAHYWMMPGMGHFPICEHPEEFRGHLDKALNLIGEGSD